MYMLNISCVIIVFCYFSRYICFFYMHYICKGVSTPGHITFFVQSCYINMTSMNKALQCHHNSHCLKYAK